MNVFQRYFSYLINPGLRNHTEKVFEGIAHGRQKTLYNWFNDTWTSIRLTAQQLTASSMHFHKRETSAIRAVLLEQEKMFKDFSEIFITDKNGYVLTSTFERFSDTKKEKEYLCVFNERKSYMYGPYIDEDTLTIGKCCSDFFDEVTLMFIEPFTIDDTLEYFLCGRIPNDVMSDLLQDEDSHIYKESGDNYLFMIKNKRGIPAGSAISRSRFEDSTFTLGDNLKNGIKTKGFGTVTIKRHTEFEIIFNDPATGKLHAGVQKTIDNGSNLEAWPGYPEYRHILVGGKGIIIRPPHTDETWGLLCEGDIDEIYKYKSLNMKFFSILGFINAIFILCFIFLITGIPGLRYIWMISQWSIVMISTIAAFNFLSLKPLKNTIDLLEEIAEGEGDLTKRVNAGKNDQMGELARWFNKFVNNQMHIVHRIKNATKISKNSVNQLEILSDEMGISTKSISKSINGLSSTMNTFTDGLTDVQKSFYEITSSIQRIYDTMYDAKNEMCATNNNALSSKKESELTYQVMDEIVKEIDLATNSMIQLENYSEHISEIINIINNISNQTKLLALNASIEAARAAEHGKGFTVVANEIGGLANSTIEATKNISEQINKIQSEIVSNTAKISEIGEKINLGSLNVKKTIDSFTKIQNDIDGISNNMEIISMQIDEDKNSIDTIAGSMNDVVLNFKNTASGTSKECNDMLSILEQNELKMRQIKDTLEYSSNNLYSLVNEFKTE